MAQKLDFIVSGGQTGADRAALDFAITHQIPHRGWCPRGRKAEDGRLPDRYRLRETTSGGYKQRTEWNVRDSDGTVIFTLAEKLTGGSLKTMQFAQRAGRPVIHLNPTFPDPAQSLAEFVARHGIRTLNVAGSRASKEPGVYRFVQGILGKAFA